jgi:hypothetical protein
MFKCDVCSYETNRKFNLEQHMSRKNKCKPKLIIGETKPVNIVHNCVNNSADNGKIDSLTCNVCFKKFNSRQAKSQHKNKKTKCTPPIDSPETEKEELERLRKEVETLKESSKGASINNNDDNNMVKIENDMLKKNIENIKLKNINEALKKELETLSNKTKPKRGFVNQVTRNKIASSQKWCCRLCDIILPGVFHIDHTIPLRYGGGDIRENVSALCIQCHAEKTQNDFELYDIK